MPSKKRTKTKYPGVYFIEGQAASGKGSEKIYYILYRLNGKQIEEKAGRQYVDDMTPAKAAGIRGQRIEGKELSNTEKRIEKEREQASRLDHVFTLYCAASAHKKSMKDEQSYFKNWIDPFIGKKRLDEIVLLDLERIRKKMTAKGKAPRSIQYIKSIVRQIYNFAAERSLYTGALPTIHFLKKQKLDNKRQRYLSPEEAGTLLEEIGKVSPTTYRMSLLSLNTGMRFGEIASLQWQHINTKSRSILIIDPKNGESRTAYMTNETLTMFFEMERGKPGDLVFPSRKDDKMKSASKTFFRAVDRLGLNEGITDPRMKVVFHTLRHSCASWLVNAGVEIPTIAKILGHKSLEMTTRYSHVNDTSVKNAMQTLDRQQQPSGKIVEMRNNN